MREVIYGLIGETGHLSKTRFSTWRMGLGMVCLIKVVAPFSSRDGFEEINKIKASLLMRSGKCR